MGISNVLVALGIGYIAGNKKAQHEASKFLNKFGGVTSKVIDVLNKGVGANELTTNSESTDETVE